MGNSLTHAVNRNSNFMNSHNGAYSSRASTTPRHQKSCYHSTSADAAASGSKSKTLPARHSRRGYQDAPMHRSKTPPPNAAPPPPHGETSRMLFLLYLIHRTWNVVVETVDTRSKRSRRSTATAQHSAATRTTTTSTTTATKSSKAAQKTYFGAELSFSNSDGDCSLNITDLDEAEIASSFCCSQYSYCSCCYCYDAVQQNVYNSIAGDSIDSERASKCGSDISAYYQQRYAPNQPQQQHRKQHHHQMAPSVCQNSPKLTAAHGGATTNVAAVTIGGGGTTISSASIAQKSHCGGSSINGSMASYKMSSSENSWTQPVSNKENQRPPVYNPEDYVQSLKKFGKRPNGPNLRSIYDNSSSDSGHPGASNGKTDGPSKSSTLPHKHAEYKSPIPAPPESDSEMSLRQFASVTDLLTKLRADLRVSFPSFVQEFVATPSDGISLLLEVLRAIQLSQTSSTSASALAQQQTASMPRSTQSYQRRALLDELACLQCLSICCSRSLDATSRLGTTPVGLMPLASSATGQGIRARILAMQLMTSACDKNALGGHGSQKSVAAGHTAVSEAMSTLRLRCSEPVRFRLLVGMLNSGGGSGELQAVGMKFLNTFLESAENLQQRLYLQAELFQAGLEPSTLAKTITSASIWLDTLRNEIKRFQELYVDVDKMITQAREADRVRSQMVILERRVQILHEEKAVLTSMERRLQERCAELQREIFRLQGAQHENTFKSLDKQPIALPRHVPPGKQESEHEDEGISSSETGPSLSPVPILVLPQKTNGHNSSSLGDKQLHKNKESANGGPAADGSAITTTIEDVIEELDNIVSEAEKQMSAQQRQHQLNAAKEKEIVPVNIVPQPPRKSRSLAHLVSQADGSDLDGSEYGMLMLHKHGGGVGVDSTEMAANVNALQTFFDDTDYDMPALDKPYSIESPDIPEVSANTTAYNASATRELLDVIMNARHNDNDPTMKAFREAGQPTHHHHHNTAAKANNINKNVGSKKPGVKDKLAPQPPPLLAKNPQAPAQHFNGVFFMTGMNTPQKYPKPDVTAALQARRVTKNVERLEAVFASSHESLLDTAATNSGTAIGGVPVVREKSRSNQQIYFGSNPTLRLNNNHSNNNVTVTTLAAATTAAAAAAAAAAMTGTAPITTRTRSYTHGGKVTDTLSGLY